MPRLSKIGAAALAAFGWTGLQTVTASYLVVAGGGGGGTNQTFDQGTGGGGAGGLLSGTTSLNPTLSYTVTVGAAGAGSTNNIINGSNGSNSVFNTITAIGGGGGSSRNASGSGVPAPGNDGGSGGGASGYYPVNVNGGNGTVGQGNNGGNNGSGWGGGGGGGASAVGANGQSSGRSGGAGGNGTASSISGSSVTYAGGGGGGGGNTTAGIGGSGGSGGGGAGGTFPDTNGSPGTANLGGGGGGSSGCSSSQPSQVGGNGGSGVVIISYTGAQQFGGGVVTSSGGNTIHTFTTSGTLSPLNRLTASYLIVAGGGGGGSDVGGGGGAGGLLSGSSLTLDTNSIYAVTVGAGGAASTTSANGVSGSSSSFSMVSTTAVGGGGGASASNAAGSSGGSGGGGTRTSGAGGAGTSGQGNNGGSGSSSTGANVSAAGGGGGASAVGSNATGGVGGNGGAGTSSSISGTSTTYAGGGGGRCDGSGTQGTGGSGGGGNAGTTGVAGTANLGGGGGGGSSSGGNGGSGVVIISYAGSTPQMAGGTVTVAGGNVIHTFTSSGYLSPITNLNNSLRFRASASAYLNRTPTATGNRQTWTFSAWIKRGALGGTYRILQAATTASPSTDDQYFGFLFNSSDQLVCGLQTITPFATSQVFRDPAAWYHIVLVMDTTNSTAASRVRLFVNGVQVTAFSSTQTITQNQNTAVNVSSGQMAIGREIVTGTSGPFDGYMAEVNLIDGQALTPSSFGAFNGQGVWQPITYGGSYGTNGFYLPFNTQTSSYVGSFNGSNQYLTVPANAAFNMGSGDFTVEAFVYFSASGRQIIQSQTSSSGANVDASFFLERSSSNYLNFGVFSGGSNYYATGTTTIPTGKWVHVAGVRSGNTIYSYMDGVLQGTASVTGVSLNSSVYNLQISGYGGATGLFVNGYVSNLRIVKGTAVYTGNFTPPTSALSAISGTSLLTLQNASIVDNSTNAFTITNNNTVTTGQTYPFAYGIFNDQGPAGNNWTPNNISGAFGSTLDYMTDVPTNTSATVANYPTLNPLDKGGNITLSEANLTYSTGATNMARATMQIPNTGKWYWECAQTSANQEDFGIATASASLGTYLGGDANGWSYGGSGNKFNNNVSTAYGASFGIGDVIGVAFDAGAGTLTFYKNNVSQGTAFSGLTGTYFPAVGSNLSSGVINFGQRPFTYTPPSGFVALNTFNLATPTIGATPATTANKYFDVSLYSGNGTSTGNTQVITNTGGFQPDFVWIKARNSSTPFHILNDSVRGTNKILYSNSTDVENSVSNVFNSFNSNGFTVDYNSSFSQTVTNQNGQTYVGWQWRASNATAVTNTAGSITSTVSANTTAGFSIVTYTGNGTVSTVGHGLGVAPNFIIIKCRSNATNWFVGGSNIATAGNGTWSSVMEGLNTTSAVNTGATAVFNSTAPTSSVVTLGTEANANGNGRTFVMYCWAEVAGYSKFGSYTGNGSSDGPFIFTGFRPRFVFVKNASSTGSWIEFDSSTNPYNEAGNLINLNTSGAEFTTSDIKFDILSNGFKVRQVNSAVNGSGNTLIYAAFAESPFKYANAR